MHVGYPTHAPTSTNCRTLPKSHLIEHNKQLQHTLTLLQALCPNSQHYTNILWAAHNSAPIRVRLASLPLSTFLVAPTHMEWSTKASHTAHLTIGAPLKPTLLTPLVVTNVLQRCFTLKPLASFLFAYYFARLTLFHMSNHEPSNLFVKSST